MLVVAIGLIVVTVGLGFARGNPLSQNLLAGITAAIAAIPEEPPVLLAVVLGLGAYRLLRRSVLVRRLNAEEILGAIDLVVTDKTGTITQNRLAVASVTDRSGGGAGREDVPDAVAATHFAPRMTPGSTARESGTSSFTQALEQAIVSAGGEPAPRPSGSRLRRTAHRCTTVCHDDRSPVGSSRNPLPGCARGRARPRDRAACAEAGGVARDDRDA